MNSATAFPISAQDIYELACSITDELPVSCVLSNSLRHALSRANQTDLWPLIPLMCCLATGGQVEQGKIVAATFVIANIAASTLDDVEDGDSDSALWRAIGYPQAINLGVALAFVAQVALARLRNEGVEENVVAHLQDSYAHMVLTMCAGQQQDLTAQWQIDFPLDAYWQMAEAKTATFFSWGCKAGASLGSAPSAAYAKFGYHIGLLHQIGNDLGGFWGKDGKQDLPSGKQILPLVYAQAMAPGPVKTQVQTAWRASAHDLTAATTVRQLVLQLGVPLYLGAFAEHHYQEACTALEQAPGNPQIHAMLLKLIDQLCHPASLNTA